MKQLFGYTEPGTPEGYVKYVALFQDGENYELQVRDRDGKLNTIRLDDKTARELGGALPANFMVVKDPEDNLHLNLPFSMCITNELLQGEKNNLEFIANIIAGRFHADVMELLADSKDIL